MSESLIPINTGRAKPYLVQVTTQDVPMRGLPEELHGAVCVHLTDLHAGFGNTDPVIEFAIERVNSLSPDIILFTGDYVDDHATVPNYPIADVLRRFQARLGVFGSFGNHDHRRGIETSREQILAGGIHLLNNESFCVNPGLWIAGVDDFFEGKPDVQRALANVPDDVTTIVLSHNPRLIERVPEHDVFILSGHTHGAQIALPFPTPKMVCWLHLRCPQVAGWYTNGRARSYVNRGLGVTGQPFRYRCPAEIAVFRLIPDPNALTPAIRSRAKAASEPAGRV